MHVVFSNRLETKFIFFKIDFSADTWDGESYFTIPRIISWQMA